MDNKKDNIPLLRFQEFKGNWTEMKLSEVAEKIQDGTHFSPTVSKEGEFLYITAKNVKNGYIDLTNSQYISKEAHDKIYARCDVKIGDVLVTKDGTIGQVCVNTLEKPFSLLSSVAFVRPKKQTNNKFIYQLISSPLGQREISKSIAGQALKRITLTKLNQFKYYFPTLPEQQKIASFLTAVDKKIQQLTRKKELLEQYKKGVMQKLFSQELRFKDENGKDYPDWEVKRIAEVFEEITESVGKREIETYSISAGVGFVSQKEKFGKDISGQQNKKYNVVKPNQFSYNKGNSKTYKYGCIYLNNFEFPIAVPYVFISFKLIVSSMDTVFFAKLFEHHYLDKGLRQIISSSARMDGLLNVNKKYFFGLRIPLPSEMEQQKIANYLSNIDTKIESANNQIIQTQTFKKGLLQQMFV